MIGYLPWHSSSQGSSSAVPPRGLRRSTANLKPPSLPMVSTGASCSTVCWAPELPNSSPQEGFTGPARRSSYRPAAGRVSFLGKRGPGRPSVLRARVVEDIADTGLTLDVVVARVRAREPASVRRCALLVREDCPRPGFSGFRIGRGFVVGYGLDYAEQYGGLRDIRVLV